MVAAKTQEDLLPTRRRSLYQWATYIGTVIYCGGALWYSLAMRNEVWGMCPHDAAEYLAGIFAPLAFIWVVSGYFQQGEELNNSVTALRLQAKEMADMSEVARRQYEADEAARRSEREAADRAALPVLTLGFSGMDSVVDKQGEAAKRYNFDLHNHGPTCTDVVISFNGVFFGRQTSLRAEEPRRLTLVLPEFVPTANQTVEIEFEASNGKRAEVDFFILAVGMPDPAQSTFTQPQRIKKLEK